MAMKTAFVVQPFEIHRKRLRPARQEPTQTESGAIKKAENLAKRMPGAAAIRVVADDETVQFVTREAFPDLAVGTASSGVASAILMPAVVAARNAARAAQQAKEAKAAEAAGNQPGAPGAPPGGQPGFGGPGRPQPGQPGGRPPGVGARGSRGS